MIPCSYVEITDRFSHWKIGRWWCCYTGLLNQTGAVRVRLSPPLFCSKRHGADSGRATHDVCLNDNLKPCHWNGWYIGKSARLESESARKGSASSTLACSAMLYTLRSRDDKLFLCRAGKEIAVFTDPKEDTADTICNILNAEEQRWPPEGNSPVSRQMPILTET